MSGVSWKGIWESADVDVIAARTERDWESFMTPMVNWFPGQSFSLEQMYH